MICSSKVTQKWLQRLLAGTDIFWKTDSINHHHPEGVVYRSLCLNYSTLAVRKVTSRRWWCIESLFTILFTLACCVFQTVRGVQGVRRRALIGALLFASVGCLGRTPKLIFRASIKQQHATLTNKTTANIETASFTLRPFGSNFLGSCPCTRHLLL